ncbi:IS3 family transposase [Niallia sp. FSL W8-0635]|uniref:IS3 family transposase n=1 Tax=Niallia sp. FSL W8-0635 TaxID=2975337 RepID=UPI0030F871B5
MKKKEKWTAEGKLFVVQLYESGKYSFAEVAKQMGIDRKSVSKWVKLYRTYGIEALIPRNSCAFYEPSFKLEVLKYREETGASYLTTAIRFNLSSPYTIQRWEEQYNLVGVKAFVSKKEGTSAMPKKGPVESDKMKELQAEIEQLRMENAYFKKVESLSSGQGKITKEDKVMAIYELRHKFPVIKLLMIAKLSRSTYYYLVKKKNLPDRDAKLRKEITSIFNEHYGRYGYRRVTQALHNRGLLVNHKKVQRIMKELGLKCMIRMKKYKSYKGGVGKTAPHILKRNFQATQPNKKWVTDITEFKLFGEKLYLSPILDLYNQEIITYTIGSRPTYSLVSQMIEQAFEHLPKNHEGLIMHSDQGWHYQMEPYQTALKKQNIIQSMSRKGNCYDNAVMENFFGIMKSEFFYQTEFENKKHFLEELEAYMYYYNTKRIKMKLNGLSPIDYRTQTMSA